MGCWWKQNRSSEARDKTQEELWGMTTIRRPDDVDGRLLLPDPLWARSTNGLLPPSVAQPVLSDPRNQGWKASWALVTMIQSWPMPVVLHHKYNYTDNYTVALEYIQYLLWAINETRRNCYLYGLRLGTLMYKVYSARQFESFDILRKQANASFVGEGILPTTSKT